MARVCCPECDNYEKVPFDYERSTIRCSECGSKIPVDSPDESPPRRLKKKKKKNAAAKFAKSALETLGRVNTSIKIAVGVAIVANLLACVHPVCYILPVGYAIILVLLGTFALIMVTLGDSVVEFLMCLFVPFYFIFYIVTHWEETKVAAYMWLFGIVVSWPLACVAPVHVFVYGIGDAGIPIPVRRQ